jgi:hypothetical protein
VRDAAYVIFGRLLEEEPPRPPSLDAGASMRPGQRRKDPKTGKKVRVRVEPDKALYHEGGEDKPKEAWGLKFLPIHTRTPA